MNEGAAAGALCGLVFALVIGTAVGAVFLRAGISLYNKLAGGPGSPTSVPEPTFGKAMGITFVTVLVNAVAGFAIGFVFAAAHWHRQRISRGRADSLIPQLISFPVSLLVMSAMLSAMLPTSFGRAVLVTLCYALIAVLVVGVLVLVVVLVAGMGLL